MQSFPKNFRWWKCEIFLSLWDTASCAMRCLEPREIVLEHFRGKRHKNITSLKCEVFKSSLHLDFSLDKQELKNGQIVITGQKWIEMWKFPDLSQKLRLFWKFAKKTKRGDDKVTATRSDRDICALLRKAKARCVGPGFACRLQSPFHSGDKNVVLWVGFSFLTLSSVFTTQ